MANGMGRRRMLKSTAVAAGALIAGGGGAVAATLASEPALERVVIDCGFKGGPAHHAHGRGVRDRLHDVVLEAVASAAPRGHRAQLRAAEEAFERAVAG